MHVETRGQSLFVCLFACFEAGSLSEPGSLYYHCLLPAELQVSISCYPSGWTLNAMGNTNSGSQDGAVKTLPTQLSLEPKSQVFIRRKEKAKVHMTRRQRFEDVVLCSYFEDRLSRRILKMQL